MAPKSEPEDPNPNPNSTADTVDVALDASDPLNVYKLQHSLPAKARLDWFISSFRANPRYRGRWETEIMQNTTCLAADPVHGTVVFEVLITDALCTIMGNLHGGAAATILDQLTSLVLHTYTPTTGPEAGYGATATRTLTVTCLRPVFAGATVRVEAELVGRGRTMGHVRGEIKTVPDGKVCFACAHDKVILPRVAAANL